MTSNEVWMVFCIVGLFLCMVTQYVIYNKPLPKTDEYLVDKEDARVHPDRIETERWVLYRGRYGTRFVTAWFATREDAEYARQMFEVKPK